MSVMKPSVVTDTTLPPNLEMLSRHSPTTLIIKAVVHEANTGFYRSVAVTLKDFPVKVSKLFLLDRPLTTFP